MKRENMKVGMKVVVEPHATGSAGNYRGEVVTLKYDGNFWVSDGCSILLPEEVRKATQEEILAAMTTQELQQFLDDIQAGR